MFDYKHIAIGFIVSSALLAGEKAVAVEGGVGAYFLGTRDTLSGIVPPPGTYLSFTYDHLSGDVQGLSVGGLPIRADANIDVNLIRLGATQAFEQKIWGGTPAINITVPILDTSLAFTAITGPLDGLEVEDETSGIGDITITGLLGWHSEKLHYSVGLSVYAPAGSYDTATIDLATLSVDALSNGKNVWSFQPTFAATYLNPETGLEISGAGSLLFSTKNDATEYQTAPALQLEGAVVQRLPSGWGFGLTGYAYQQLDDDSGSGADAIKAFLGAESLKARVFGAGPIVVYSGGELFGGDLSFKAKYVKEFGAKRRLESDIVTVGLSLAY